MCLSCIRTTKSKQIYVSSGWEFLDDIRPKPEMLEQFGKFGCITRVFIDDNFGNKYEASEELVEEIGINALAVIYTATDNMMFIHAIQWPNSYRVKNIPLVP